jgi:hypothetical protein
MSDRIYSRADPVVAGPIDAKKGILIVGGGTLEVKFNKPIDHTSGLTIGGMNRQQAQDADTLLTGSVTGSIVPIAIHTLSRVDVGTTVYKLA